MSPSNFAEQDNKDLKQALQQEKALLAELRAENKALCAQGLQLKALLKASESKDFKSKINELYQVKEKLEQEIQALQQAFEAQQKSYEGLIEAKDADLLAAYNNEKMQTEEIKALHKQISILKEKILAENASLQSKEKARKESFLKLENDIASIKQNVMRIARETNDLKMRYLEAIKEKVAALSQLHQMNKEVEKSAKEAFEAKKKASELEAHFTEEQKRISEDFKSQRSALLVSIDKLEDNLRSLALENEALKTSLEQIKSENEELKSDRAALDEEKNLLIKDLKECKQQAQDSKEELEVAKQHMARKIKEAALLNEKIEQLNDEIALNSRVQAELKGQCQEFEKKLEEEKVKQEQALKAVQALEQEKSLYDEKLALQHAEYAKLEKQALYLKSIEAKHVEMQKLLGGLGRVLSSSENSSSATVNAEAKAFDTDQLRDESLKQNPTVEDLPLKKACESSLFDQPKKESPKIKTHLF